MSLEGMIVRQWVSNRIELDRDRANGEKKWAGWCDETAETRVLLPRGPRAGVLKRAQTQGEEEEQRWTFAETRLVPRTVLSRVVPVVGVRVAALCRAEGENERDEKNAGKGDEDGRIREIARWRASHAVCVVRCLHTHQATPRHAALHSCSCKTKMSRARIASAAQLAAAVAVILRILFASADPIAYTDEQTYEQTTYTVPVSSTENDSDIYRGKCNHSIRTHYGDGTFSTQSGRPDEWMVLDRTTRLSSFCSSFFFCFWYPAEKHKKRRINI